MYNQGDGLCDLNCNVFECDHDGQDCRWEGAIYGSRVSVASALGLETAINPEYKTNGAHAINVIDYGCLGDVDDVSALESAVLSAVASSTAPRASASHPSALLWRGACAW